MTVSRRQVLAGTGTAVLGTATVGVASAETYRDGIPDDVTVTFDRSLLEQYQPLVDASASRLQVTPTAQYAWVSRTPDEELTALSYWTFYPNQEGLSAADSHVLDREPLVVFIDESAGRIERVNYSAYHWLKGATTTPPLYEDSHPSFRAIERWHHYVPDYEKAGSFIELTDLREVFSGWLNTGFEEDLAPGLAHAPWSLRRRESWWKRGTEETFNEIILSIGQATGIGLGRGAASEVER